MDKPLIIHLNYNIEQVLFSKYQNQNNLPGDYLNEQKEIINKQGGKKRKKTHYIDKSEI